MSFSNSSTWCTKSKIHTWHEAARPWSYLGSTIKLIWRGAPPKKGRGSEATEAVFCVRTKKPFHGTVRTYRVHLFYSLSYCLQQSYVCTPDCESCTLLISTNPASTEASDVELSRGTYFLANRLEYVIFSSTFQSTCYTVEDVVGCLPTACITSCETIKARGNVDWQNTQHKKYTIIIVSSMQY